MVCAVSALVYLGEGFVVVNCLNPKYPYAQCEKPLKKLTFKMPCITKTVHPSFPFILF